MNEWFIELGHYPRVCLVEGGWGGGVGGDEVRSAGIQVMHIDPCTCCQSPSTDTLPSFFVLLHGFPLVIIIFN